MGLGKTIQVSSFLSCLFGSKLIQRVLILMPVSVIENWKVSDVRVCTCICSCVYVWVPCVRVCVFVRAFVHACA